jgi:2-dehydropantoate 2-reductase
MLAKRVEQGMEIAVLGVGGLGGYLGARLAQHGHRIHLIARGRNLEAIRARGVHVEAPSGAYVVKPASAEADARAVPNCDVVLVVVKNYDLDEAIETLRPFAGQKACFVSLLNGIDAVRKLDAAFPGRALAGQCYVVVELDQPGVVRQTPGPQTIVLGELDNRCSARVAALAEAFSATGMDASVSDRIEAVQWTKLTFISCLAGVVAASRSSVGEVLACSETRLLYESALREAQAVARAKNIPVSPTIVQDTLDFAATLDPSTTFSLLRDVLAGRRTEIDAFCGAIVRHGDTCGIPTPVHRFLVAVLKPADERGRRAAST